MGQTVKTTVPRVGQKETYLFKKNKLYTNRYSCPILGVGYGDPPPDVLEFLMIDHYSSREQTNTQTEDRDSR